MTHVIDRTWLEDLLVEFLRTPTEVPTGQTEVHPGDERILRAIERVLMPRIVSMKPDEIRRHPLGDVCARFGPPEPGGVLLLTYAVAQHGNLMEDPHSGQIIDGSPLGLDGPAALGQGATQNKGSLAAAFAAVQSLPRELGKPAWLAVNTEGESSHGGSMRILDDLDISADFGIVVIGTDQRISIANRGRVDVEVKVKGMSAHSSQPWLGANAIEGGADVVRALRHVPLPEADSQLGPAAITPYQFSCYPIAPHTLPEECRLVIDRRLLPGETPEVAMSAIRDHVEALARDGLTFEAHLGKWMLPASVDEDEAVVVALQHAAERLDLPVPELLISPNTFDAGYACHKGIPTPMFGPGRRQFSGKDLMGLDAVGIKECVDSASVILHAIEELCD